MGRPNTRLNISTFVLLLALSLSSVPALAQYVVRGTVHFNDGTPAAGVIVSDAGGPASDVADARGEFALEAGAPVSRLLLEHLELGIRRSIDVHNEQVLHIVIESPGLVESITVTAAPTPMRIDAVASSVSILQGPDLERTAAATLDDTLRQIPGFTLFRRSGSRTANPTAQGVSLRGIGASGASRSLVLDDGFPLNDPFGGWVSWGSIPLEAAGRVEVLRGGASDLYGSGALSGVIRIVRRPPGSDYVAGQAAAGDSATVVGSLYWVRGGPGWRAAFAADGFATDGYTPVTPLERGDADRDAGSEHWLVEGGVERPLATGRIFGRVSRFEEGRENGTLLQRNDTRITRISTGVDTRLGAVSIEARLFGVDQEYDQTFSALSDDRATERLVRLQHVPAEALGGSLRGTAAIRSRSVVSAGVDVMRVEGTSEESGPPFTTIVPTGGRQTTSGLWIHDHTQLTPRTSATLAVRADFWTSEQTDGAGAGLERRDEAFSPRAALVHSLDDRWSLMLSGYRSFRAPTLNELYRGFRVGDIVTQPNPDLRAETLTGWEAGALYSTRVVRARVTAYQMTVHDPVSNFTLDVTPELITRQRRNLGQTRTRGLEIDLEARLGRWRWSSGYLHSDARVVDDGVAGLLEGKRVAQIPRHQVTAQVAFDAHPWDAALQARWSGEQYEDDRNEMILERFTVADMRVGRYLSPSVSLFLAAENVLDEHYEIGRTPIVTLGQPRTVRLGLRYVSP